MEDIGPAATPGALQTVTFAVGVSKSIAGNPNPRAVYQWQRNDGAGFYSIAGANAAYYSISPLLSDNGAKFRAIICIPGASVTSDEATLTVVQPNTAPSFTKGADQNVPEDSGPNSIHDWATDIQAHSILRNAVVYGSTFDSGPLTPTPITYSTDFSSTPPGLAVYGNASVGGGVLHLTDAVNRQQGTAVIENFAGGSILSFTARFNVRMAESTCCGGPRPADGMSFNFASDLPNGVGGPNGPCCGAEDGQGTGLTISFDMWDNGAGNDTDAPAIEVIYGGQVKATVSLDGALVGTGMIITNDIPLGTHEVTLVVDDGNTGTDPSCKGPASGSVSCSKTVTVITGCEAVEELVLVVEQTTLDRKTKRPFIATLKASCASFNRGSCASGVNQLGAFQNKVRSQIGHDDPATAQRLIAATQAVIDAFKSCECYYTTLVP